MTNTIVLLARAPSADGKTRLTAKLDREPAVALRRALLLDTFSAVRSLDVRLAVAYTPDDAQREIEALLPSSRAVFVAQRGADLGERMRNALTDAFQSGADAVILIGSDLPTLPPSHVADAFALLESGADVVLGPTDDGGYYLIGVSRGVELAERAGALFRKIQWGTGEVLAQTIAAAQDTGLMTALVRRWYDVDRPEDLSRVAEDRKAPARRTRDWIAANRG